MQTTSCKVNYFNIAVMKKIMFNDKYGLTQAVLEGRKTMTRRIVPQSVLNYYLYEAEDPTIIDAAKYDIGEVVAIAQPYKDVGSSSFEEWERHTDWFEAGFNNKMFVRADRMPHHIYISDIKVEKLQDISDEDCMKEGIMEGEFMNTWDRYYYDEWGDVPNHITFQTPRKALASLIDKVSGKGTWKRNPYCFCYTFELIKS